MQKKGEAKKPSFFDGESYKRYKVNVRLVREGSEKHDPVRIERAQDFCEFMGVLGESDWERFYSFCLDARSKLVNCEDVATGHCREASRLLAGYLQIRHPELLSRPGGA